MDPVFAMEFPYCLSYASLDFFRSGGGKSRSS